MASFLGLCNYYRRLIPYFAEWAVPLYKQVLETQVMSSEVLERAFAKLKGDLSNSVALQLPNPDKPFVVETDASIHEVGADFFEEECLAGLSGSGDQNSGRVSESDHDSDMDRIVIDDVSE